MKIKIAVLVVFLSIVISAVTAPYPHCYGGLSRPIQDIKFLNASVDLFRLDNNRYPTEEEGLKILVSKALDELPKWKQYVKELPLDSWGKPYLYQITNNEAGFLIYSSGPDLIPESGLGDDIISGKKEYPCEVYGTCHQSEVNDYIWYFSTALLLVSLVYIVITACCSISRFVLRVIKKNKT